jgi:cytochrome c oxidase subunit IV
MAAHAETAAAPGERLKPQTKEIWQTFWILLVATAIEFVIAFTFAHGIVRVAIFLGLTVIKAFYIVGNFMHLRHEMKALIWCIILPTVFVMWAIVVFLAEGGSIFAAR